ncbi:MAG: response regulator [Chitinophagaceae bacterium]
MPATPSHILIIDDNEDILYMIKAMLEMHGYKVSVKQNIIELELGLTELCPDAIIMDMLLSGADGLEVCRMLKANEKFSHIPLIMISAHPSAKKECKEAGANYFVEKPFDMNDLVAIVKTALK